jgi:polyadenylate-binding protein
MNARNIQPPPQQQQPTLPLNAATGAPAGTRGGQSTVSAPGGGVQQAAGGPVVDGGSLENLPMDKFVAAVQNAEATEQKQLLGEKLYSMIKHWHPEWVGKLTGMLLEIDNRELLAMIMDHRDEAATSNLRKRVDSALQVLVANKQQLASDHSKGGE